MYLRTVLRSRSSCRAMAETDSPCRCKSKIITSSPSRITAAPLPPIGRDHRVIGDQRAVGPPGARPGGPASHLGKIQNGGSGENHSGADTWVYPLGLIGAQQVARWKSQA